jgi:lipoprotein-releasing system permease protein
MFIQSHIAGKMLRSTGELALLRSLTWISIGGISIGVALLIIVLSVFNGFFKVVQSVLTSWDPDLKIERVDGSHFNPDQLLKDISTIDEIVQSSPYIEGKALLAGPQQRDKVVIVRGVDLANFFQLQAIKDNVEAGNLDVSVQQGRVGLLMGRNLAFDLGLRVNDEVGVLSAAGMKKRLTQFAAPKAVPFEIRGIFKMQELFEGSIVFTSLPYASRLFETKGGVNAVDLKLKQRENAENIKAEIAALVGPSYLVKSWYDIQKPVYDVMQLEKWASFVLLMIIILVAVLNIIGSMSMIVIQKRRDIAVLRTLGLISSEIKTIFLLQGLRIGGIGAGVGLVVGFVGAWLQKTYKIVTLSDAFIIDAYPIDILWTDVVLVVVGAILFCLLASLYPSTKAAKTPISEALVS